MFRKVVLVLCMLMLYSVVADRIPWFVYEQNPNTRTQDQGLDPRTQDQELETGPQDKKLETGPQDQELETGPQDQELETGPQDQESETGPQDQDSKNLTGISGRRGGSCECGISPVPHSRMDFGVRIIGGKEVHPPNKYPWMVTLRLKQKNIHQCGGSIIAPFYVLTAAHCFLRQNYVRALDPQYHRCQTRDGAVGQCFLKAHEIIVAYQAGQRMLSRHVEVDRGIIHEDYNVGNFYNDIALIKVVRPFPCNGNIRPICLPRNVPPLPPSQKVIVSGWGATENSRDSNILLEATNIIRLCDRLPRHICAQAEGRGSCFGDSGGPAFAPVGRQFYVFGVTSFGDPKCDKRVPTAYSDVKLFTDWIYNRMM